MTGGWTNTTLGRMTDFLSGGTPSKDRVDFWDGSIPWVRESTGQRDVKVAESILAKEASIRGGDAQPLPLAEVRAGQL